MHVCMCVRNIDENEKNKNWSENRTCINGIFKFEFKCDGTSFVRHGVGIRIYILQYI